MSLQEIKERALKLPPHERETLAQELWASVAFKEHGQGEPELESVLRRRIDEIDSGRVRTRPAHEAMQELKEKYFKDR